MNNVTTITATTTTINVTNNTDTTMTPIPDNDNDTNGSLEDTSWLLILIPYYIIHGMMILGLIVILFLSTFSLPFVFYTLENVAYMVGVTFLLFVWDDNHTIFQKDDKNATTNWNNWIE